MRSTSLSSIRPEGLGKASLWSVGAYCVSRHDQMKMGSDAPVFLVERYTFPSVNHVECVDDSRLVGRIRRRPVHHAPCVVSICLPGPSSRRTVNQDESTRLYRRLNPALHLIPFLLVVRYTRHRLECCPSSFGADEPITYSRFLMRAWQERLPISPVQLDMWKSTDQTPILWCTFFQSSPSPDSSGRVGIQER